MNSSSPASEPLLSVVIPLFNQQACLPQCLRSVLEQSVTDLEVLVVDDGSTDGSAALAEAMALEDGRLRVLRQANAGAGAARNHGLRHARGRYVHFLDADDWLEPEAYAHWQQALARCPQADVLLCNFNEVDAETGQVRRVQSYPVQEEGCHVGSFEAFPLMLLQGTVVPWNRWLRRAFLQELGARFDEIRFANDRAFNFRTLPHARQVVVLGAALVNYRVGNAQSLTGQAGLPRMLATLQAVQASLEAVTHLPRHAQFKVFTLCMEDLLGLLQRAEPQQQPAMQQALLQALAQPWMMPFPLKAALFGRAPWWEQWQAIAPQMAQA